ncbi:hypothetical protein HK097_004859 [Rhizophlyctis rosea]|uniref:Uncharacterized protein n=1 Tax=Rhizophlyctis rosea TaxID=64517 RepID=A0AAD5S203_9FUNG|nr:hypothetical protein HK097_004859 [Rhizophlyctis rosea]
MPDKWKVPVHKIVDYRKKHKKRALVVGDFVYALYRETEEDEPLTEFYGGRVLKVGEKSALVRYDSGEERRVRLDELFGEFEVPEGFGRKGKGKDKEREKEREKGVVERVRRGSSKGSGSRDSSPVSALSSVSGDEITQAQYTVLGTVISTNVNQGNSTTGVLASPQNYNATIQIQCVYASYNPSTNDGSNILSTSVTVTGFGSPRAACPNGGGATATQNQSTIFFLFVANSPPKGQTPVLSVFDICTGGVGYDPTNLARVGDVLALKPELAFYGAARGPQMCEVTGLPKDGPPQGSSAVPTGVANSDTQLPSGAESEVLGGKGLMGGVVALVVGLGSVLFV